ncbi:MAG: T9SS type A sorting domain-containing protein, partial [Bacteroidota bacterium]
SGSTDDAATLDFVATGINSTLTNFPDANWNINLANSNNGNITYFTNSAVGGLINDDTTGWRADKTANQRTPGFVNPNQICGTIGDTPPVFVNLFRRPYVPDPDVRDSIIAVISDNILVAEATLHLTMNDGDEQSIPMAEVNHDLKIWGAVIEPDLNQEGNRFSYYLSATDNNGLQTVSQKSGYFVGLKQLSFDDIRSVDSLGVAKYLNYGVRVQGAATVSDHVFATNKLDAYIQDEQGGINLYVPEASSGDTIHITENLPYTIEGTLIQFRGKLEISIPGFKKINDGGIPPRTPIDLTIEEYNASPELFEGSLIRFQDVVKDSGDWPLPNTFGTIKISDGTGSTIMYIDNDTDLDNFPEPQYPLSVIGIASQYGNSQPPFTSGYQIIPRRRADIVAVGSPLGFDLVSPEYGTTLQFIHGNHSAQFVWNAAVDPNNDTLRYKIEFAADETFIQPLDIIASEQNGLLASYRLTGTKAEAFIDAIMPTRDSVVAYWRVMVQDPSGNIAMSNQIRRISLIVRNARPAPFTLIAPINNDRIVVPDSAGASPLAMKWKKSVDTNIQDTVFYYVLFCENKGFADSTLFSPNIVGNNLVIGKDTVLNVSKQKLRQKYFNTQPRDSVRVYWVVRARDVFGTVHEIASTDTFRLTLRKNSLGVTEQDALIPNVYSLAQNYPNPFNPATTIRFGLPKESYVTLHIFNVLGEIVADVVNEHLNAGNFEVEWNAASVPSGIYFYRLHAGEFVQTKKLLLLK